MRSTASAALATALGLAACAAHAPAADSGGSEACARYRAQTVEQRRAAAEAHIVQMHGRSDEQHLERHLQMMERRCGAPRG